MHLSNLSAHIFFPLVYRAFKARPNEAARHSLYCEFQEESGQEEPKTALLGSYSERKGPY